MMKWGAGLSCWLLAWSAMAGLFIGPGVTVLNGAVGPVVTWNPSDIGAGIVLSGGNLTSSSSTAAWASGRATISRSSGHFYFEVWMLSIANLNDVMVGIADASMSTASFVGHDVHGFGYQAAGAKWNNGTNTAVGGASGGSSVLGVEIDMTGHTIDVYHDCTNAAGGHAFTGIPSVAYFPAFANFNDIGNMTAHFAAGSFNCTVPTGATAWQ